MSAGLPLAAALLLAQTPALAASDQPPAFPDRPVQEQWDRAQELARKGMQDLLRSFELFKESIPQYGVPYVTPEGDIVIPRKRRTVPGTPVPEPKPERT